MNVAKNPLAEALPEHFQPEFLEQPSLHIVPLGGLGEIGGLNMMAYRYGDEIIVVDCGGQFPDRSLLGIDMVIPDMSFLKAYRDNVKALILTHGHEDHIGATPYFLKEFSVPVYGTGFTLKLLDEKLKEHEITDRKPFHEVRPKDRIEFEHFNVSFLHVNHSVCDAVSLAIDTPEGLLVHTGDFKIDHTPAMEDVFDYEGFAGLGRRGVLALLSDSTNVQRQGYSKSEKEVSRELDTIFHRSKGRILLTLFASSIPRMKEVVEIAARYGRVVHIAGRSMNTTTRIARDLGLLKIPDSILIKSDEVDRLPPEKVLVLLTGSQGEPRSVLSRVAMNDHKEIRIRKGDTVIFSARVIPGHERSISNIINHLSMRGAEVYYEHTHEVHASGHAYSGELTTMLNLVKPRYFIPIHGEYYHLVKHGCLAEKCGVKRENVLIVRNGDVVQFDKGRAAFVDRVETGRVYIDGKGVGDVGPEEVRERRKISQTGVIVAIMGLGRKKGEIDYGPELISRGFTFEEDAESLFRECKDEVVRAVSGMSIEMSQDTREVQEEIRLAIRRFFNRRLMRKPVVIPIVL